MLRRFPCKQNHQPLTFTTSTSSKFSLSSSLRFINSSTNSSNATTTTTEIRKSLSNNIKTFSPHRVVKFDPRENPADRDPEFDAKVRAENGGYARPRPPRLALAVEYCLFKLCTAREGKADAQEPDWISIPQLLRALPDKLLEDLEKDDLFTDPKRGGLKNFIGYTLHERCEFKLEQTPVIIPGAPDEKEQNNQNEQDRNVAVKSKAKKPLLLFANKFSTFSTTPAPSSSTSASQQQKNVRMQQTWYVRSIRKDSDLVKIVQILNGFLLSQGKDEMGGVLLNDVPKIMLAQDPSSRNAVEFLWSFSNLGRSFRAAAWAIPGSLFMLETTTALDNFLVYDEREIVSEYFKEDVGVFHHHENPKSSSDATKNEVEKQKEKNKNTSKRDWDGKLVLQLTNVSAQILLRRSGKVIAFETLFEFVPTYFIPIEMVAEALKPRGYTEEHIRFYFSSSSSSPHYHNGHGNSIDSSTKLVTLPKTNKTFVRLFGNTKMMANTKLDLSALARTNQKEQFRKFDPLAIENYQLVVNRCCDILRREGPLSLVRLYEKFYSYPHQQRQQNDNGEQLQLLKFPFVEQQQQREDSSAPADVENSLLFFSQLQHLFEFNINSANKGEIFIRLSRKMQPLTWETSPCPLMLSCLSNKLAVTAKLSVAQLERELEPAALKQAQLCFPSWRDFCQAHSLLFRFNSSQQQEEREKVNGSEKQDEEEESAKTAITRRTNKNNNNNNLVQYVTHLHSQEYKIERNKAPNCAEL